MAAGCINRPSGCLQAAGGGLQAAGGGLQVATGVLLAWLGCSKRPNCGQRQRREKEREKCG